MTTLMQRSTHLPASWLLRVLRPKLQSRSSARTVDDALCAAVVAAGQCAESLLPGRVPYRQFDAPAAVLDDLSLEVNTCTFDVQAVVLGRTAGRDYHMNPVSSGENSLMK